MAWKFSTVWSTPLPQRTLISFTQQWWPGIYFLLKVNKILSLYLRIFIISLLWCVQITKFCFRLCVATLHFNENGRRHQATTGAGAAQWYVSYPKGKKGQTAVVKPHKTLMVPWQLYFGSRKKGNRYKCIISLCTNNDTRINGQFIFFKWYIDCLFSFIDNVEELRINLVERRRQFTSCPSAAAEADAIIGYKPPPLTSSYVPINKEELVAMRWSMFAIWKDIVVDGRGPMCDQISS